MSETGNCISIPIIGYHRSPLSQKFGIPRQPNLVALTSYIDLISPYNTAEAFEGLAQFSHLWIIWQAHHNKQPPLSGSQTFKPKVRPPRLGGNAKLGVFATRSTYRPSQQGLSVVQLIEVEVSDSKVRLHILGADMVDGTPIVDIKPYITYSDAITEAVSGFAPDKPVVKPVKITNSTQSKLEAILFETEIKTKTKHVNESSGFDANVLMPRETNQHYNLVENDLAGGDLGKSGLNEDKLNEDKLNTDDIDIICQLIAQDPRPAYYQTNNIRVFKMRYKFIDVHFKMAEDGVLWIIDIISY